MIIRSEVELSIRRCEPQAGWASMDFTPATVSAGDLRVLIEAAKRAKYEVPDRSGTGSANDGLGYDS